MIDGTWCTACGKALKSFPHLTYVGKEMKPRVCFNLSACRKRQENLELA